MTKVALVTGGTRGIGRAIAEDLAHDHHLVVTWRHTKPAAMPEGVTALRADLTEPGAAEDVVEEVLKRFARLNVIVNNAGHAAPSPPDRLDAAASRAMLDVNLLAPSAVLAAALLHLKPGAAVVNISSVNAVLPPRGASIYGASKAALNLWTRAMAKELGGRGIRVNAVAPGAIEIPDETRPPDLVELFVADTALGRIGTPEDVARAVRFLAGDQAAFVTGEVLTVSGGIQALSPRRTPQDRTGGVRAAPSPRPTSRNSR